MSEFLFETSCVSDGNMSERYGAHDVVMCSRESFYARIGSAHTARVLMQVSHGDTICSVTMHDITSPTTTCEAEALMTRDPSIALMLLTGDCLPVAYLDRARGVCALAHLGWRPATLGLAARVVVALGETYGTTPQDLEVRIGPGIALQSYVFEQVTQQGHAWLPFLAEGPDGRFHVDLKGFVRAELLSAGVAPACIHTHRADTAQSLDFFSHYRSRTTGAPEGRMLTLLARSG